MIALLSAEIQLFPDWTFFIELFIFLCVLFVLSRFVFSPTIKLMKLRKKFTSDADKLAGELATNVDQLNKEYNDAIAKALSEAGQIRKRNLEKAYGESDKLIEAGKAQARAISDATKIDISKMDKHLSSSVKEDSVKVSEEIISKVLS